MVRGLQRPQNAPRARNFKIFPFFAWPLCQNALRQRLRTDFILHPTGPASERPYAFEGDPLNFGPRPPWAADPKKFFFKFSKILTVEGQFFECAKRGPQGPPGIKFWQLYHGPFPQEKIQKFRRKSMISRVTRKIEEIKKSRMCALLPLKVVQSTPPGVCR